MKCDPFWRIWALGSHVVMNGNNSLLYCTPCREATMFGRLGILNVLTAYSVSNLCWVSWAPSPHVFIESSSVNSGQPLMSKPLVSFDLPDALVRS